MYQYEKHFTLDEARKWLPKLRRRFTAAHRLYEELDSLQTDFVKMSERIRLNGHAPKPTTFEQRMVELQGLLQEIVDAGIEIKDVERGLVDFPAIIEGEEVFLCWQLSESDIEYYHGIEEGFPGRKRL